MPDNSYINALIQYLKAECDLAWEQIQNGGSNDAKDEGRVAYNYMTMLLTQISRDTKNDIFMTKAEDEDDNN